MGTVWLHKIFTRLAHYYELNMQVSNANGESLRSETDILFANHSQTDLSELGDFVGSHMIRDPRDAIVSGYFFHLWTDEQWAHEARADLGGKSYQEHLNGLSQEEGIEAEIGRFETYIQHYRLDQWNYDDPRMFEIKYEKLIHDEASEFENLFRHYGFDKKAIRLGLDFAEQVSFKNVTQRKMGEESQRSHLRSGKPRQWVDILTPKHCELIKSRFGELLIRMGYEKDQQW